MIRVKDVIKVLQALPPDMPVVIFDGAGFYRAAKALNRMRLYRVKVYSAGSGWWDLRPMKGKKTQIALGIG